jgi:hypothetical protein
VLGPGLCPCRQGRAQLRRPHARTWGGAGARVEPDLSLGAERGHPRLRLRAFGADC